jgi:glycosyltransferase involved in cell wall biosynthesis
MVIVGSAVDTDKEYEQSLHRLACELGVEEQVLFLGQRSDTVEITTELTISCLASNREPLGRVILEAHILGCPVVASDNGGPAEIIEDERTGLLFSATSSDASDRLANQVIRLLRDPLLRSRLAGAANEKIKVTFAGLEHVRRQESLILALCQRNELRKQINQTR